MKPQVCKWCGGEIRPICGDVAEYDTSLGHGWYHEECIGPMETCAAYYEFRFAENYEEYLEAQACAETVADTRV